MLDVIFILILWNKIDAWRCASMNLILKTWVEDFVDEDTGEVVSIERNEVVLDREVVADAPEKSISAAETFAYDLEDQDEIFRELLRLTERAGARLRARSLRSKTIGLKVRFSDFSNLTRSKTLSLSISGSHDERGSQKPDGRRGEFECWQGVPECAQSFF